MDFLLIAYFLAGGQFCLYILYLIPNDHVWPRWGEGVKISENLTTWYMDAPIGKSRKNIILQMCINKNMADCAMIPKSAEEWLNCWKNVKEWEAMLKLGVENEIDSRFLNARLKTIFKNPSFFLLKDVRSRNNSCWKKSGLVLIYGHL